MTKMGAPACNRCGGRFLCSGCDRTLSNQFATMHELDHALMANVGALPDVRDYLAAIAARSPYALSFPRGENGGAMVDFGRAVVLECFVPYTAEGTRRVSPFMPRPFDGRTVVHDLRGTIVSLEEIAACKAGRCDCDSRPTGWILTKPILRALLSVSDHWLNEFGRLLPGALATWAVTVSTPLFMESLFSPDFTLPTRAASRPVRAARARARRRGCRSPSPPRRTRRLG